ncbi:heme oxygenase 1 isoform X2 [Bacillus rossius redtenbacheri]|uniref:heme oxygenase 1 isoform X2 n=1 Tax=Bacillus rossius redtenbacheri TaxID=93214 RepID=UPI002FDCCE7F
MTEESFTTKMRKATREIHSISDSLVNAKLAFALSDDDVWTEGLLIFYEIFRYLEQALDRHRNSPLARLDLEALRRTEAFEKDLSFYLGSDWKSSYVVGDAVAAYLLHLRKVESADPVMLSAYVYHLYMGLLSGGQVLGHKRRLLARLPFAGAAREGGDAVTSFGDAPIPRLKCEMKAAMNALAGDLDEAARQMLLEESKTVFARNNEVIRSVKGGTHVVLTKMLILVIPVSVALMLFALLVFYKK